MKVPKMTAQASCCPVVRDFGTRTKASCPSRWAPDPVSCIVHRSELQCLKGCEPKAYRSTLVYAKFVCERLTLEVCRSKGVSNLFVYPEPRFPRSVCLCKAYRKCVVDQGSSSAEKKVCRCVVCALCFNGNKGGAEDARADVFVSVLKYCVHMATMGSLHAVVLENVRGILEKTQKGQGPSFMDAVLEALRMAVPQFDWQVAVLRAQDFRLPQKRTRVFLRGLRRCFGEVPAPLAPMGELPLEAFLKPNLPPVNRASVTACIRRNLKDAERELLQKWDSGELSAKDIICFPADRAGGKTYARVYQKNMVPTLTTSGMYLFLVSVGCLRKPDNKRRYFRFLDSTERLTLQGFRKDVLASSPDCLRRKASGNAYPVPLVAAVLAPMLQQLSRPELQSELDRAPDKSSVKAALAARRFEEALVSKSTAACNRDVQATHMQQQPKRASQTSSAAASQPQPKKRRANACIKSSSSS